MRELTELIPHTVYKTTNNKKKNINQNDLTYDKKNPLWFIL